jgi:hypothetical protein
MNRNILLLLCVAAFFSCKKNDEEPQAPEIEWDHFEYISQDNTGKYNVVAANIRFKDVNGDIGRTQNELINACGQPVYDLFMYYEYKQNGTYHQKVIPLQNPDTVWDSSCNFTLEDTIPFVIEHSVEFIQPEGNNKSIEGDIKYIMDESALFGIDQIGRFRIYLVDRAGHKSNEVYSEDLVLY